MTLKEKIKDLVWFDLIAKLKDILSNFSAKFDNLTGRVSKLESNTVTSVPTIDEVLNSGAFATDDKFIQIQNDDMSKLSFIDIETMRVKTATGAITIDRGIEIRFNNNAGFGQASIKADYSSGNNTYYYLPPRNSGDKTLATLETTAPTSSTATGMMGEIRIDANYIYICIATNTWKRSALTTW